MMTMTDTTTHQIGRDFVLAGRAVFTVQNPHGERYTFKVARKDSTNPRYPDPSFFLSLMTGSANDADSSFDYVGIVIPTTGAIRFTKGSTVPATDRRAKVAQWALLQLWNRNTLPAGYSIHHEGRCGACGRALTVPESIITGFGPDCAERLGIKAPAGGWPKLALDANGMDSVDRAEVALGVQ